MGKNREELFRNLKERYTKEEAKQVIDGLLSKYGDTVRIAFRETDAEIVDSYLVDSMDDRHLVCEIIARTGVTKRTYEDLSAEWRFHNVSYKAGIKKDSAKDVSLDYGKDPRAAVRIATDVFNKLDLE